MIYIIFAASFVLAGLIFKEWLKKNKAQEEKHRKELIGKFATIIMLCCECNREIGRKVMPRSRPIIDTQVVDSIAKELSQKGQKECLGCGISFPCKFILKYEWEKLPGDKHSHYLIEGKEYVKDLKTGKMTPVDRV